MRRLVLVAALAGLAACDAGTPGGPMPPLGAENACGAEGLQGLVGQGEQVLKGIALPEATRVIRPGMAVTQDFSPGRLNIEVDARGTIIRVFCG